MEDSPGVGFRRKRDLLQHSLTAQGLACVYEYIFHFACVLCIMYDGSTHYALLFINF